MASENGINQLLRWIETTRSLIYKNIKAGHPPGTDLDYIRKLVAHVQSFRDACIKLMIIDPDTAFKAGIEQPLWQHHAALNTEFRKIKTGLRQNKAPQNIVQKIVQKWNKFLDDSTSFYEGYLDQLKTFYELTNLNQIGVFYSSRSRPPPSVNVGRIKSSHATFAHFFLVRLGDIARYKAQARGESVHFDKAIELYSLAQEILPTSSLAHHQMGLVSRFQKDHLATVYRFFRALAMKDPHELAKQNLETELHSSRSKTASTSAKPQVLENLAKWFVELHENIYFDTGAAGSPKHDEMEATMMQHLEVAVKNENTAVLRKTLVQIALTNICAHEIKRLAIQADDKLADSKDSTDAYLLRMSCRLIAKLCQLLVKELDQTKFSFEERHLPGENSKGKSTTTVITNILPSLRILASWLLSMNTTIATAEKDSNPYVRDMLMQLAKAGSALLKTAMYEKTSGSAPYLLPEDVEIFGLESLSGDAIPLPGRLGYDLEKRRMKKQIGDDAPQRLTQFEEDLTRIFDISKCVRLLALDAEFPIKDSDGNPEFYVYDAAFRSTHSVGIVPNGINKGEAQTQQPAPVDTLKTNQTMSLSPAKVDSLPTAKSFDYIFDQPAPPYYGRGPYGLSTRIVARRLATYQPIDDDLMSRYWAAKAAKLEQDDAKGIPRLADIWTPGWTPPKPPSTTNGMPALQPKETQKQTSGGFDSTIHRPTKEELEQHRKTEAVVRQPKPAADEVSKPSPKRAVKTGPAGRKPSAQRRGREWWPIIDED